MSQPKIIAAFDCVHMGMAHQGLVNILRKNKIKDLGHGDLVLFLNRGRDKLKVLSGSGIVLAYVKLPDGRRLPIDAIQYIPQAFSKGGGIDIEGAIAKSVSARFEKRYGKNQGSLGQIK